MENSIDQSFSAMKIPELKSLLRAASLPVAGSKAELVARLANNKRKRSTDQSENTVEESKEEVPTLTKAKSLPSQTKKTKTAKTLLPQYLGANTAKSFNPIPGNLKIISFNVNGLRACEKKGLGDYIKRENPDILILTEVKCTRQETQLDMKSYPYVFWEDSKSQKGYAGIAVLSKLKPISSEAGIQSNSDKEGRALTIEFDTFFLVGTYVPNSGEDLQFAAKRASWDACMASHLASLRTRGKHVIWTGDLNVAYLDYDVYDGDTNGQRCKSAGFTPEERAAFHAVLLSGMVDVYRAFYPLTREDAVTFWSYRFSMRSKNKGWRLDYFVVNEDLIPFISEIVNQKEVDMSDHVPLKLVLHSPPPRAPGTGKLHLRTVNNIYYYT
jgi:exodeoxyribonuclease III